MPSVTWFIPGSPTTPTASTATSGTIDHVAAAIGRLLEQWKGKPKLAALLSALAGASQPIEDAMQQLLTQRTVDTGIGAQLDVLGSLVGQARNGLGDSDYGRYILARVSTNRSSGTVEDLITVARLVLNDDLATVIVTVYTTAAVDVLIKGDALSDSLAGILVAFLRDAHTGGVKLTMRSQPAADAASFCCGTTLFITGALSIGATQAYVFLPNSGTAAGLALLPDTGSLTFDPGVTGIVETVAYSSKIISPGLFGFQLSAPLAHAHGASTAVELVTGVGLGLGDSTNAGQPDLVAYTSPGTTGGQLANARE